MNDNMIVRIVDAGDVTEMLKTALEEEHYDPDKVTLEEYTIDGDGKTIIHGVGHGAFWDYEHSPTGASEVDFDFEINAGTTKNDVILGGLEVVITPQNPDNEQ